MFFGEKLEGGKSPRQTTCCFLLCRGPKRTYNQYRKAARWSRPEQMVPKPPGKEGGREKKKSNRLPGSKGKRDRRGPNIPPCLRLSRREKKGTPPSMSAAEGERRPRSRTCKTIARFRNPREKEPAWSESVRKKGVREKKSEPGP